MADVKGLTWTMPIEDAVALGKVLYLSSDVALREVGLTQGDIEAMDRAFESIDDFLSTQLGDDWLGDIE